MAWCRAATAAGRPHRLEWFAFATLLLVFGSRLLLFSKWLDLGSALALAAGASLLHLLVRLRRVPVSWLSTQRVFLTVLCLADLAVAYGRRPLTHVEQTDPVGLWPTFRGSPQRTGSLDPTDGGPSRPRILWRFRCSGDARLYASPALAGDEIIAVATQTHPAGGLFNCVYRVDIASGRLIHRLDLPRAGVSSPAVRGPLVVLGEGYHEDQSCHLRILDRRSGTAVGSFATQSHVESSPALDGSHVYFGAGDDGVFGVELAEDGTTRQAWHVEGDHVDAAPLVVGGTVFVGSVVGDAGQQPALLAIDAGSGERRVAHSGVVVGDRRRRRSIPPGCSTH